MNDLEFGLSRPPTGRANCATRLHTCDFLLVFNKNNILILFLSVIQALELINGLELNTCIKVNQGQI